jgi:rhodanese-related sulfurtransferase
MKFFRIVKALFTSAAWESPSTCADRLRRGDAVLVDVRSPAEWDRGVAHGAALLSLNDLLGSRTAWGPFLAEAGDREILLYCATGARSGLAARVLAQEGFKAVYTGGLTDWALAPWPVAKPRRN